MGSEDRHKEQMKEMQRRLQRDMDLDTSAWRVGVQSDLGNQDSYNRFIHKEKFWDIKQIRFKRKLK